MRERVYMNSVLPTFANRKWKVSHISFLRGYDPIEITQAMRLFCAKNCWLVPHDAAASLSGGHPLDRRL